MTRIPARAAAPALAAAYLVFAAWWAGARLGEMYFLRGDDVARIAEAVQARGWAWAWDGGWLPLPRWLLAMTLRLWPDPYRAPLLLGAAQGALALALAGLLAGRWFPREPGAATLAISWVALNGMFHKLALSAGTEPQAWLALLAACLFWSRWEDGRRPRDAWLCAASLALATLTRYETWLFAAGFAAAALPRLPGPRRLPWAAAAFSLAALCVLCHEWALRNGALPAGLPLSYGGLRLGARDGVLPAPLWTPLREWYLTAPLQCAGGLAAALALWRRRPELRPVFAGTAAMLLGLAALSVTVGFTESMPGRVFTSLSLLLAPAAAGALLTRLPPAAKRPAAALALLSALLPLPRRMPRPPSWPQTEPCQELAAALVATEKAGAPRLPVLLQSETGPDEVRCAGLRFAALGRLRYAAGRELADPGAAGRLAPPSGAWVVTRTPELAATLARSGPPVGERGGAALFAWNVAPAHAGSVRSFLKNGSF